MVHRPIPRLNFTPANRTLTLTSPLGKHMTAVLDSHDRLSTVQVPGLTPMSLAYEAHGLVATVSRGDVNRR